MSAIEQSRVRAGVREGGRFSHTVRSEPTVSLNQPTRSQYGETLEETVARQADLEVASDRVKRELAAARARVSELDEHAKILEADLAAATTRIRVLQSWSTPEPAEPSQTAYLGPSHVDDTVVLSDGTVMRRYDGTSHPGEVSRVRVQLNDELSGDTANQLAALVGYEWSKLGGEGTYGFEQDSPNSIVLAVDSTKARGDVTRFADYLLYGNTISHGSPVRKTDRSGPGTAGTRAVTGLGGQPSVNVYFA